MNDNARILIVDDQMQNLELLEIYLVPQGYEVIKAASGEEALGKLSAGNVDLILLDIMMPGMDGFEVIRQVRQQSAYAQLPIILVTALYKTEDRVRGIEAGCDDFISKPIDRLELLARIRSLLKLKSYNDLMNDYRNELESAKLSAEAAKEYAESIIDTVREPLIVLDPDLRVVKVSRSFCEVFKARTEETVGQHIYDLGNGQWNIPKLRELLENILPRETAFENYEVEHDFSGIGRRVMLLNARRIHGVTAKDATILLAIEDITERKLSEEKVQQMATHDSLTGLPNRMLFNDRLSSALIKAGRNRKSVGIVMLDLDNFKDVNDTLGHDAGDVLLKATTERLCGALRKSDTVARFGGDEFVLILNDLEEKEAAIPIVQKIVDSFSKPFFLGAHQLSVSASVGVAIYPDNGKDEGLLLKNADIAMYQAKHAGRAQYKFYKQD